MIKDRLGQPMFGTNTHHLGDCRSTICASRRTAGAARFRFPPTSGSGSLLGLHGVACVGHAPGHQLRMARPGAGVQRREPEQGPVCRRKLDSTASRISTMSSAGFYRAFEERHRGPRELIAKRLEVYLPFIAPLSELYQPAAAIDLGCGRGEWLELLTQHGFVPQGVDLDSGMLAACHERGLSVIPGEAVEFLRSLDNESQSVVSGFHIAEHVPFDSLEQLVVESLRVLKPGGLLILETPNPENLIVGTSGFYLDPTHLRPIPPPLLSFLPAYHGFQRVKTLRLQESAGLAGRDDIGLFDVLAGEAPITL